MIKKYLIPLFIILLSASAVKAQDWSSWKNIHGIAWDTNTSLNDRCRYAKSLGYGNVTISSDTYAQVAAATYKNGLNFRIMDPYINRYLFEHLPGTYTASGSSVGFASYHVYSQAEKDFYNKYMMWGTTTEGVEPTWGSHLVPGYWYSPGNAFTCRWDFQQQAVLDYVVPLTVSIAGSYTSAVNNFTFNGIDFDVVPLSGVFGSWTGSADNAVTLTSITGAESSILHGTITHEYSTYSDGLAAYYKQLMAALNIVYGTGNVHWTGQPGYIYKANPSIAQDDWLWTLAQRPDWNLLNQSDYFIVENDTHESYLSAAIDNGTISCPPDRRGSSYHTNFEESNMRRVATELGTAGCWFIWWGRVAGSPYSTNAITQVPARCQLVRWIPNQDNLAGIGTSSRSAPTVNGTTSYQSLLPGGQVRSLITNHWMCSRPYGTPTMIYAAVGTTATDVSLVIAPTETLLSVTTANTFFEAGSSTNDWAYNDSTKTLSIAGTATIDNGSWTGYIITLGTVTAVGQSVYSGGAVTCRGYPRTLSSNIVNDIENGLVGRWTFIEGTGTIAVDTGNGSSYANGVVTGGPTWYRNGTITALQFDGIDDYVNIPYNAQTNIEGSNSVSVSSWVSFTTLDGSQQPIVEKRRYTSSVINGGYSLRIIADRRFGFYCHNNNTGSGVLSTTTVATNTVYFVCGIYDGTNVSKIYINGIQQGTNTAVSGLGTHTTTNITLSSAVSSQNLAGYIDDARIYNRELSLSEVQTLATNGAR